MKHLIVSVGLLSAGLVVLAFTRFGVIFSDVEAKSAASEITEWIKLAVALVTLLIGLVNLRLALHKKDGDR